MVASARVLAPTRSPPFVGGLAATGLGARNDHLASGRGKEAGSREADGRAHQIHETGGKKPDARLSCIAIGH